MADGYISQIKTPDNKVYLFKDSEKTDEKVAQVGNTEDKDFPIILKNTNNTTDETANVKYSNNTTTDATTTKPFTFNPSTGTLKVTQIKIGTKDDSKGLFPVLNNWNQIGASNLYWYRSYINNYYGSRSHVDNWDSGKNIGTAATTSAAAAKGTVNFYNSAAANATQTKTLLEANANTNSNITITLPSSTGTLALTSEIPTNLNQLTNGPGYVTSSGITSVTIGATSPVQSSTSTAQTGSSASTTISLKDAYGDTKNPYGTKAKNLILAGPSSGNNAAPTFRALVAADIPNSILKWQTTTEESTALYDFGVYVNSNNANGSAMSGGNYFNILNVPYRKASGNTKADWGWQLGNATANDGRLWYRTSGDNVWGDWQTIAHATQSSSDTGSSSQPVYMTKTGVITAITAVGASYGGTGKTTLKDSANALINALDTGSSDLTAGDYVITQYAGGGTTTTSYHRRPANKVVNGTLIKAALGTNSTHGNAFLRKDGTWQTPPYPVTSVATLTGAIAASDLVTKLGLSKAMNFLGVATDTITDGGTEDPKIGGNATTVKAGDVVIDSASSREYVWSTTGKWELLGGDSSYWVSSTGTTGQFWRGDNSWSNEISGGILKITASSNTLSIGSQNSSFTHIYNSASIPFIFNNTVLTVSGNLGNTTYPFNNLYIGKTSNRSIYYVGTKVTNAMITFLDNTADAYGNGIKIGGGGVVVVGAGESAANLSVTPSSEALYLTADGAINIEAGGDTIANRIGMQVTTAGHVIPVKAESNNSNAQDLGSSSAYWRSIYAQGSIYITKAGETGIEVNNTQATNPNKVAFIVGTSGNGGIYSRKHSKWIVYADASGGVTLNGNANTATSAGKWTTARTLTIGSTGKSVDGSGNVSWTLAEIGALASTTKYAASNSVGGAATNTATTANTTDSIYPIGVKSGATTTLLHDTSITMQGGALSATTYTVDSHVTLQYNSTDSSLEFVFA